METSETDMFFGVQDNKENTNISPADDTSKISRLDLSDISDRDSSRVPTRNAFVSTPRKNRQHTLRCPISPIAHKLKSQRTSITKSLHGSKHIDENATKSHSMLIRSKITKRKISSASKGSNKDSNICTTGHDFCTHITTSKDDSILGSLLHSDSDSSMPCALFDLSSMSVRLEPHITNPSNDDVIVISDDSVNLNNSMGKNLDLSPIKKFKYNLPNLSTDNICSNSQLTSSDNNQIDSTKWNSLVVNEPSNRVIDFTNTQSTINESTSSDSLHTVEVPKKKIEPIKKKPRADVLALVSKLVEASKRRRMVKFDTLNENADKDTTNINNIHKENNNKPTLSKTQCRAVNGKQLKHVLISLILFFFHVFSI